jgi:hypothetical protein
VDEGTDVRHTVVIRVIVLKEVGLGGGGGGGERKGVIIAFL